jgi:hypothetical protein
VLAVAADDELPDSPPPPHADRAIALDTARATLHIVVLLRILNQKY